MQAPIIYLPFQDNNAGKELSVASISRWICTTIVDSYASTQGTKHIPGKVKAHVVSAVATSLQLFNKVDLQAVMKTGRWSSGGTCISFYLTVYFVSSGSYNPLSSVLPF